MPIVFMSHPRPVRRLQTVISEDEWVRLEAYLRKKNVKVYTLLKRALKEYLERHP